MSYFDPTIWRPFTQKEMLDYLDSSKEGGEKKRPSNLDQTDRRDNILVVQKMTSPLDVYTYLKSRFGVPNGMQTILKIDDSDNLFHWDYYLMAGDRRLFFIGATQEVHIWTQDALLDKEWIQLINALKADYARAGKAKSQVTGTLEKWHVFPNQFLSIANQCGKAFDELQISIEAMSNTVAQPKLSQDPKAYEERSRSMGKLYDVVASSCIELGILTPVMFEAFIGLIIALTIKSDIKENDRLYKAFIRSQLDVKLYELHLKCNGFARAIRTDNPYMQRYWDIVNRRNDIIHGNIDPVKDAIEIIYFDGKIPLFKSGGDRIEAFHKSLERMYKPDSIIADYVATHEFIYDIIDHMDEKHQNSVVILMRDTQPGYDEKRKRYGHLFPNEVVTFAFDNMRYDSDLIA